MVKMINKMAPVKTCKHAHKNKKPEVISTFSVKVLKRIYKL